MMAFHETSPSGPTANLAKQLQSSIPVIETERLVLRAPRIEDFEAFASMVDGPRGAFYGEPKTREDAWEIFMQITGTWLLRGHGAWTVTEHGSDAAIGFVQIGAEPGDQEPELGYIVSEDAEGRGIAQEAAAAIRAYALGAFALPSLVSYVDEENIRSAQLAERLGGRRDAKAESALPDDDKCLVYRYLRPEDV